MKKLISLMLVSSLWASACSKISYSPTLTRAHLEESLALGTEFLLANQKSAGNFNYSYNFETQTFSEDDNQVRQAGALWGLSLLYAHQPSPELETAIIKGLDFYGKDAFPEYPGDEEGKAGSLALLCLSLLDFLSVEEAPKRQIYEAQLETWLASLVQLQNKDQTFYGKYEYDTGEGKSKNSPYSDGEALLALSKAANYFESEEYFNLANEALDAMWQDHVEEALEENPDSDDTKGFYQWVTMALYEMDHFQATRNTLPSKEYMEKAVELAYWMIDVHKTLDRTRNTAYAYEGLITAYELAKRYNTDGDYDRELQKLFETIDIGMSKLTSWQVGHSTQILYIQENAKNDPLARGGITNSATEADLRIDVTQHQMHAVILALKWVYTK
ncbi:hypothetical protein IPG41_03305 [Candidatus Peregrinibacteria bacterium]|nr:MAG: hypothetical protein IPG41_03305 [Candidatus Peregrinibacteria bacterium]